MYKPTREDVVEWLESRPRIGAEVDTPEGSRRVVLGEISETLLRQIIEAIKAQ